MSEGYRLVEEIWIDASPERVFRAWTDRDDHRGGWPPVLEMLRSYLEE